jgi:hypothetical protein
MEVLNFPMFASGGAMSPLVTAVHNQNYCMLAVLLAHGAKVVTRKKKSIVPLERGWLFSPALKGMD